MVSSSSCLVQVVQRLVLQLDILSRDVKYYKSSPLLQNMFDSLSKKRTNKTLEKNPHLVEDVDLLLLPCPSASFLAEEAPLSLSPFNFASGNTQKKGIVIV